MHAKRHILPNTICMSVPRRCLITVEMGQATPIGQAILQCDLDLDAPKHIYLMIFVLWDRKINGRNSFFHPYYEILPPTLSNMPIFWSDEELDALQGSYLLQQIADRTAAIEDDYRAICRIAPLAGICTLEEFKWARMCVCSRNFGLQMDGHRTSALVPHADMLNHYRPRETKWTFDEDRQAFTITSLQHIPAGAQVYDSYGQKCNHRFLLNYGFAVEDNRELDGFCPNEVPVELHVDPDDPLFQEKLDFWTRGESSSAAIGVSTVSPPSPSSSSSGYPLWTSATASSSHHHHNAAASSSSTPVVKRVRICVSNNENTRLLFSLLRVLACNREELRALSTDMGRLGSLAAGMSLDQSSSSYTAQQQQQYAPPFSIHHHHHHHHPDATSSYSASAASLSNSCYPYARSQQAASSAPSYPYQHHNNTHTRSCRDVRHPISLRNERAALRLLLEVVRRHLQRYPTSLSQDESDLQDLLRFPRFSNQRHAKIQVRGEKVVLHHLAEWARTGLGVLAVLEDEVERVRHETETRAAADSALEDHGVEVQLLAQSPGVGSPTTGASSLFRGGVLHQSSLPPSSNASGQPRQHLIVFDPVHTPSQPQPSLRSSGLPPSTPPRASAATTTTASSSSGVAAPELDESPFERTIARMEDELDNGVHHTIVRYCADVLGSLRREELKLARRRPQLERQQQQQQHHLHEQQQRGRYRSSHGNTTTSSRSPHRPASEGRSSYRPPYV